MVIASSVLPLDSGKGVSKKTCCYYFWKDDVDFVEDLAEDCNRNDDDGDDDDENWKKIRSFVEWYDSW